MFRNPRQNAQVPVGQQVKPSVGRAPSPHYLPSTPSGAANYANSGHMTTTGANMAGPIIGRAPVPRAKPKPITPKNGNIMNFFKRAPYSNGDALFVDGATLGDLSSSDPPFDVPYAEDVAAVVHVPSRQDETERFNESGGSSKRRRLSLSAGEERDAEAQHRLDASGAGTKACSPPPPDFDDETNPSAGEVIQGEATLAPEAPLRRAGPFLEDSDSDREHLDGHTTDDTPRAEQIPLNDSVGPVIKDIKDDAAYDAASGPPSLKHESTSLPDRDTFADFEGMGDFEDEYEEGDEFMERRYQMEQRRIEMREEGFEGDMDDDEFEAMIKVEEGDEDPGGLEAVEDSSASCPVCNASFAGVSDQEASVHVNHCLDGNPTPLPTPKPAIKAEVHAEKAEPTQGPQKFRRPVRPAKPGQENPFTLGESNNGSSAFSRLMSGKAEDNAWATAAADEHASRGKPAYQRTCPFYKILPGFNICVDAFRYGAVQGCNAYFLSHFHSDHYIGLTSTWCHGPIYCSRPTANLVRQQLRVDPKWVIDLEFEKKDEVPGTNGVHVTMIPANHCPGSSLYLFEKVIGKGKNPKIQRVLHCGDFRACPAHVEHPLLKPDVVDSISGKTKQQKIDVCYLDTTYLNPKYAFPSQEEVIQACADMCVSLNKSKVDKSDTFEQMKAARAGGSMTKFVRQDSKTESTADEKIVEGDVDTKPTAFDQLKEPKRGQLLVVIGTYSIGKERICLGIARALNSLIYAPAGKQRIVRALEDPEILSRMTSDPRKAQVHMTPLFEIRAETLGDYLAEYSDSFSRVVGFRPSGWNYRPPGSRFTESPAVQTVLFSENWKSGYGMRDLMPQRGSNSRAATYGVPYSEHSSFRELTMFCCALRIEKVIPTVNVGSAKSREKMKVWVDRWHTWQRKEGLFRVMRPEDRIVKLEDGGKTKLEGTMGEWYAGNGTWELRTTL